MEGDVKLFISVCSGRGWAAKFGQSLAALALTLGHHKLGGRMGGINITVSSQAHIIVQRQAHLDQALREGFTHFLSLDDDMTFPPDTVDRLLAHDLPVVTVNYRKKTPEKIECVCGTFEGKALSSEGKAGLERVAQMGMGVTFIKMSAISHVPRPYFATIWKKETENFLIEDGVFSALLFEHGVEIWCDHDLSQKVGHIGEIEYKLPQTELDLRPSLPGLEHVPDAVGVERGAMQ